MPHGMMGSSDDKETGEFETFAAQALGTDDPERISALREAIMSCKVTEKEGGYSKEIAAGEGDEMSMLFGGKK